MSGVLEQATQQVTSRFVIDFSDDRNQRCRADTQSRIPAYQRADWSIVPAVSGYFAQQVRKLEPVA